MHEYAGNRILCTKHTGFMHKPGLNKCINLVHSSPTIEKSL